MDNKSWKNWAAVNVVNGVQKYMFPLDKKIKFLEFLGLFFIIVSAIEIPVLLFPLIKSSSLVEVFSKIDLSQSNGMTRFLYGHTEIWNIGDLINCLVCLLAFIFLLKSFSPAKLAFQVLVVFRSFGLVLFLFMIIYPNPLLEDFTKKYGNNFEQFKVLRLTGYCVWLFFELGLFIWVLRQLKDKKVLSGLKRGSNG